MTNPEDKTNDGTYNETPTKPPALFPAHLMGDNPQKSGVQYRVDQVFNDRRTSQ